MSAPPQKKSARLLGLLSVLYLLTALIMHRGDDPTFAFRYAAFFLLILTLVQVIFPEFRFSKLMNLVTSTVVLGGLFLISTIS